MDISSRILFQHPREPCLGVFCPRSGRSGRPWWETTAPPMSRRRAFRQRFGERGRKRDARAFPRRRRLLLHPPPCFGKRWGFSALGGFGLFFHFNFSIVNSDCLHQPWICCSRERRAAPPVRDRHPCPRPQLSSRHMSSRGRRGEKKKSLFLGYHA